MMTQPAHVVLDETSWRATAAAHAEVADTLTAGRRRRAGIGERHPVDDFLFTYYTLRPAQLRTWYPGAGTGLAGASERADWRFHRYSDGVAEVDVPALLAAKGDQIRLVDRLLGATAGRSAQFGCFGLHEWAMVYRQPAQQVRHVGWPLRLGPAGTDAVVDGAQIRCSHYDAFRFFTPAARPLNQLQPTLESRVESEQPGCLHAGMDLYKWAYKLVPAVPSALLLDCFRLARRIREVDMRASPYDLSGLGYSPIPIETAAGKAEYVALQREFTELGVPLRTRLRAVTEQLLTAG
jgi:hypothetical protein